MVFATETLALGINMPARTVVIEKLTKCNGETHADITPGEYTQLTGRAGRRGLDVEGHGVVLWQPGMDPRELAGLASTRTYPLRSSFRPSYNMAVNLVHQFGRARARALLEMSFAQFQADRAVVGLARQLGKAEEALAGYAEAAACDRGRLHGVRRTAPPDLRRREGRGQGAPRRPPRRGARLAGDAPARGRDRGARRAKFAGLRRGPRPGHGRRDEPRPYVLTADRQARRLSMVDFPTPVDGADQDAGAQALQRPQPPGAAGPRLGPAGAHPRPDPTAAPGAGGGGPRLARPTARSQRCARSWRRTPATAARTARTTPAGPSAGSSWTGTPPTLKRRVEQRTNTVARTFDRVCEVLDALDYLDGDTVTERGRHLMRIYSDMDLVAAEALRRGLWDGLSAPELAAALSALVFESRRTDDASPRVARAAGSAAVLRETIDLWRELAALEAEHRLDFLREPDLGFAWAAWRWAEGDDLDDVLRGHAAGRRRLRALGQAAASTWPVRSPTPPGRPPLRETARDVVGVLRRGVVAYSSLSD